MCSPYFSFGIDCETPTRFEEGLFEIMNKVKTEIWHMFLNNCYKLFCFIFRAQARSSTDTIV